MQAHPILDLGRVTKGAGVGRHEMLSLALALGKRDSCFRGREARGRSPCGDGTGGDGWQETSVPPGAAGTQVAPRRVPFAPELSGAERMMMSPVPMAARRGRLLSEAKEHRLGEEMWVIHPRSEPARARARAQPSFATKLEFLTDRRTQTSLLTNQNVLRVGWGGTSPGISFVFVFFF